MYFAKNDFVIMKTNFKTHVRSSLSCSRKNQFNEFICIQKVIHLYRHPV